MSSSVSSTILRLGFVQFEHGLLFISIANRCATRVDQVVLLGVGLALKFLGYLDQVHVVLHRTSPLRLRWGKKQNEPPFGGGPLLHYPALQDVDLAVGQVKVLYLQGKVLDRLRMCNVW